MSLDFVRVKWAVSQKRSVECLLHSKASLKVSGWRWWLFVKEWMEESCLTLFSQSLVLNFMLLLFRITLSRRCWFVMQSQSLTQAELPLSTPIPPIPAATPQWLMLPSESWVWCTCEFTLASDIFLLWTSLCHTGIQPYSNMGQGFLRCKNSMIWPSVLSKSWHHRPLIVLQSKFSKNLSKFNSYLVKILTWAAFT